MDTSMGAPILLSVLVWGLPVFAIILVANSRGRSLHYAWWVALSWPGAIIVIALILLQPDVAAAERRLPAAPPGERRNHRALMRRPR